MDRQGVAMIIQREDHTVLNRGYSAVFAARILRVVCLKKLTNGRGGGYGHPRLP